MHVPYSCKGFLLLPNSITEYLYPYYLRYDKRFFNTKFAEVTQRSRRDFEIRHQTNRRLRFMLRVPQHTRLMLRVPQHTRMMVNFGDYFRQKWFKNILLAGLSMKLEIEIEVYDSPTPLYLHRETATNLIQR